MQYTQTYVYIYTRVQVYIGTAVASSGDARELLVIEDRSARDTLNAIRAGLFVDIA
jgi:hypothetical protein